MQKLCFVLALAVGCSTSEATNPEPAPQPTPPTAECPATHTADGPACVPRFDACGEAQIATLGGGCVDVGVPRDGCGAGFVHDGRGGCSATLPKDRCAPGMIAYPGVATCEPIAACGDTWGDVPDSPSTMHVDAAASGGGDGTRARPFRTIAAAVTAAPNDGVVAITDGDYEEDIVVDKPLRVVGRCPSRVTVRGVSTDERTAAFKIAARATLERVSITGPRAGVIVNASGVTVSSVRVFGASTQTGVWFQTGVTDGVVRHSVIEDVSTHGVLITGSRARVEDCLIRGVRDKDGFNGGVRVNLDPVTFATAEGVVVGSLLEDNEYVGAQVISSALTFERTVVRDSRPLGGEWGVGVIASYYPAAMIASTLTLKTSAIERNSYIGVLARQANVVIDRSVVRDTRVEEKDKNYGRGIVVQGIKGPRAELTITDSLLERNNETGVDLNGNAGARIERTVIRDTIATGANGTGVFGEVLEKVAPDLTIDRSLLAGNPFGGAIGTGKLAVSDSRFEGNGTSGIVARGAALTVARTFIHGMRPSRDNGDGHGILAYPDESRANPSVAVEDTRIDGASKAGIAAFGGPLRVLRSVIRDVVPEPSTKQAGLCVIIEREAHDFEPSAELEATLLEACHGAGLVVSGAAATARALHIRDVKPTDGEKYGDGVVVQGVFFTLVGAKTARAEISGSVIERSARAGVALFGSELAIESSFITCNPIAINVEPVSAFNGETWIESAFALSDRGGNSCGCATDARCVAQTTNLRPMALRK